MKEITYLLDMFSDYHPEGQLATVLEKAVVCSADVDMENRSIDLVLKSEYYIPKRLLDQASGELRGIYRLFRLNIQCSHPAEEIVNIDSEELVQEFLSLEPMARGILAGARWQWDGPEKLCISLVANGKKYLLEGIPAVQRMLQQRFGVKPEILIEAAQDLEGEALYARLEQMRAEAVRDMPVYQPAAKQEKPVQSDVYFGKGVRGAAIPMNTLNLDMGNVVVEGKIFAIDHKELTKRNAVVIKFDITDNTGSVRVSRFLENKVAKPLMEHLQEGAVVRVLGKLRIDDYTHEMVLNPISIAPGSMPKRTDSATCGKRVELHMHTAMSNMDALTSTKAAIKQAAAWGHKAIAITDHGCVQSFTDALHVVEDWKGAPKVAGTEDTIKILYGCEGYYVNDVDDIQAVLGDGDIGFDEEYIAFDLETTGLSPRFDRIIEIGAVRMKRGTELERFQTFVDPGQPLDKETTDLTGITDEMLEGAPKIGEALPKLLEFIGDGVLVAHNAQFDTTFVYQEAKRLGIDFQVRSADTMVLSQCLLPQMNQHKLNLVAKELELGDFNHHRAADDALMCGKIFAALLEKLKGMGVSRLQQVNAAVQPLRMRFRQESNHTRSQHIILFAKNQLGLRNLYRLISEANLYHYKKNPRIFKSELMKYREGLIIGSACENNEVYQAVRFGLPDDQVQQLVSFYDYLEIQPISNNRFMLEDKKLRLSGDGDLRFFNMEILRHADMQGKMTVATGDVHFLNPEDEIFRHILLATKKFPDCDRDNPLYFRTTDEMLEEFSYLAERAQELVITNPNLIADMCETLRPVPHNLFAPSIENSVEDLKSLVYGKFHRLYGENPPELFCRRVETELNDIINCHYDVIYMSAQKLVQNSLDHGYLVGSRGSVGSSIVAYLSGITEVNSFPPHYRCPNKDCKHTVLDVPKGFNCGADLPDMVCPKCGSKLEKDGFNIPFETFLGFGGDKVPDIDLNFSGEYQAKAHAYCTEMFGKSHVFRAGTIGTVADKTAFGYAKKYLEERGIPATNSELTRLSTGCVGVRRTTGQHPGGLVVIPQENEIWDFCPVQHPADDPKSDQITTHFEYHSMEENLLKLDMLGHDDPTMIRMMEDLTGVDAKTIPLDDKRTMSIFTSSKVLGYENDPLLGPTGAVAVPEFNTRFTRGVLLDTMPTKFDFLVRISGYTHGTDVWLGNARDLITSKTATVDGTIGCRDDIMIYLISCGIPEKRAFKIMEAVRKGKGLPEGAEQEMIDAGVPDWYIGSCKKIKYLFPKAHAVAYVMMAFRIAWFKVNYPLAFYAAYFYRRSQKGGFDAALMTSGMDAVKANIEAIDSNEDATSKDEDLLTTLEVAYEFYLRGFEFLPIDFYKSHATQFVIEDGKLRPPFIAISGLGETAAWDLYNSREGQDFISIEEISMACPKVSKTHIQMLKDAGAFGSLPDSDQVSLF